MDLRKFNNPSQNSGVVNNNMQMTQTMESNKKDVTTDSPSEVNKELEFSSQEVVDTYLEYLKEHGFSKEDIFEALDYIITQGTLVWEFDFLEKIPVVFKMRPYWVNTKILENFETNKPSIYMTFSSKLALFNLAGSLVSYNNQTIFDGTEEGFNKAVEYVNNLPFIIQARLVDKLAVFDRLVALATSDWATQNFTKPQQDD